MVLWLFFEGILYVVLRCFELILYEELCCSILACASKLAGLRIEVTVVFND